ncbi:hypothetical protein [Sphingomonas sp.]|uniref:hypothetical protein n=1 Tax=Sphingomonas sp. TaxID=28214 RepID=UPI00286E480B|nr:hypothetical protein [Sphingomonas sp.]
MFGRKVVQSAAPRFAADPRPSHSGPDGELNRNIDSALASLSDALGLDLDFGTAYIFAPSHWQIPRVGDMLRSAGIEANMRGNVLQLLKSPASVAKLSAMAPDAPLRATLEKSGFGMVLYNPDCENGFSDNLASMQAEALKGFATDYAGNAQAQTYALFDLHRWSGDVMKGRVKVG